MPGFNKGDVIISKHLVGMHQLQHIKVEVLGKTGGDYRLRTPQEGEGRDSREFTLPVADVHQSFDIHIRAKTAKQPCRNAA